MPKGFQEDTREWILSRYGSVVINPVTMFIATVPVWGGYAQGIGLSETAAIEAVYADLTNAPEGQRERDLINGTYQPPQAKSED